MRTIDFENIMNSSLEYKPLFIIIGNLFKLILQQSHYSLPSN